MFDLKRPCVTCPFRAGQGSLFQIHPNRLEEIRRASAFQCHKTIHYGTDEYDDDGFEVTDQGDKPEQCAGLMTMLHRLGEPNQIMQVAQLLGAFDPEALDPRSECYRSWEEAVEAHLTGKEPR